MTRKDYNLIAHMLSKAQYGGELADNIDRITGFAIAVQAVADALRDDNRLFDPELFVRAVNEEPIPF